ncbi:MAG: LysM peptidoglycan-binding domain-containing protein [Bacilli bacterium]|nr:LysM peptidoglycan-binding domain-containing protein [Bacilli bacterium]
MNCKIPFTKDIDFERKVHEITSISLEHEINVEADTLKGNFIVSGDFKSHEVSVNKEAFSYILPFEIALTKDIDKDTIEFMIEDFTYEVVDNSILRVNIDFNVIASTKEIEEEEQAEEEAIFRDASELFKEEVLDLPLEEIVEEEKEERDMHIETTEIKEETKQETVSEETIMNSISGTTDEYATYHIHMVNDGESVETICTMYNSNINILGEYNNLNDLTAGDKLIIPDSHE